MFCANCGHENPDEAGFCGACGSAVAATAAAPPVSPASAPALITGAAPAPAADVLDRKRSVGYWASKALAIATALFTALILIGSVVGVLLAPLGYCLWVSITGKRPGTRSRANPVVRVILGLIPVAANGLVASQLLYLEFSYGLAFFAVAMALEAMAILFLLGAFNLIRFLWRGAGYGHTSSQP